MITNLYSVLDVPAEQFSPPFPARNTAIAGRVMDEMLKNVPEHLKCEYRLFQVGSWDDVAGTLAPVLFLVKSVRIALPILQRLDFILRGSSRRKVGP